MGVSGICHYNLCGSREVIDSLRDFYTGIVGLSVGPRPPFRSFRYWLYAGGKDVLHLTQSQTSEVRVTGVRGTFDHVAFACEDALGYATRLRANRIPYRSDTVPSRGQLQFFLVDPAGNGVELSFHARDD